KREALMKPRVIREFLAKYDGSPVPVQKIGCNVLETMGVPASRTEPTLGLITEGAESLGLITTINGKQHINLRATHLRAVPTATEEHDNGADDEPPPAPVLGGGGLDSPPPGSVSDEAEVLDASPPERNRRVFVSHGSNRQIVQHVKELLEYGD